MRFHKAYIFIFLAVFSYKFSFSQSDRADWFEDARYGMFIHWGLYSAAEGMWKGEKLRYQNDYAEWIRYRNRISKEEYGTLAQRIKWDQVDPEEWVIQAKKAGMKYIIITTKHHDGVALWDTKVNDYSLPKLSGTDRDIIAEIAEACRKHDMKLGFYYSHWIDWAHPYGWSHNQELTGKVSDKQYNQYWQEKVIPQLKELLTNYGDIAIMWFDMWIPYQKSIIQKEQLVQAAQLIRKLQPNCLINSRLGLPADSKYVDFETLGDNNFGTAYTDHPWETPGTIAHSWGYNGQETQWKSTAQIFHSLIGNISLNGDYTLNIGPRADGTIPYESQTRLNTIGNWLKTYGEAVYGNTGLGFRTDQHDWGKTTLNRHNKNVYLHIFNWPLDRTLRVSGITSKPTSIELLRKDQTPKKLDFTQHGPILHVQLPQEQPDPYNSIVRIKTDSLKLNKAVVPESTFGGFSLKSSNAINTDKLDITLYDGKNPTYAKIDKDTINWEVYLPKKGIYQVDLSAHNPTNKKVAIEIQLGKQTIKAQIKPDGKVVAEPNQHNYTEEFVDHHIKKINIDQAQELKVRFRSSDQKEIWFNHLWIKPK